LLKEFLIAQLVPQPTRVTPNGNGTIIDLVLSSLSYVQDCSVISHLDTSDYSGIVTTTKWYVPYKPNPYNPRNIWKYALAKL